MAASRVTGQIAAGETDLGSTIVTGTGTGSQAFPSPVTVGHTVVVGISWGTQVRNLDSVADQLGNTYNVLVAKISHTGGAGAGALYYSVITNGGTPVITATLNGGSFDCGIIAVEYQGTLTPDSIDAGVNQSDNADAGTAVDTPALTPSVDGCIVVAFAAGFSAVGQTLAADAPFSEAYEVASPDGPVQLMDYAQATAASVTPAWTMSGTGNCLCLAASLKPSGGRRFLLH